MKKSFKLAVILALVICMAFGILFSASAAGVVYIEQSSINGGNKYLLVSDVSAYTAGMSANRLSNISFEGSKLSANSASSYELRLLPGGSNNSCYIQNANGEYFCVESRITQVDVFKTDEDGMQYLDNSYVSGEEFSLITSSSKLNSSSTDEKSSTNGETSTIITTQVRYASEWKVAGGGSFTFRASIVGADCSYDKYIITDDAGLSVGDKDEADSFKVYAEADVYTVSFDANGGSSEPDSISVIDGEKVKKPTEEPEKDGYLFCGWYMDEEGKTSFNFGSSVNNDTKLFAKWEPIAYKVVFNGSGAKGKMANQAFEYNTPQNLNKNEFLNEGYDFAGWSDSEGGSVKYGDGANVKNLTSDENGEITLYAVWTLSADEQKDKNEHNNVQPAPARHKMTIMYVDQNGDEIAYTEERIVYTGDDYVVEPIELDGYLADQKEYKGTVEDEDFTVCVTYTQQKSGTDWWTVLMCILGVLCLGGVGTLYIMYKKGMFFKK